MYYDFNKGNVGCNVAKLRRNYQLGNGNAYRGASAILDMDKVRESIPKGKYYLLPSSIHEILLADASIVEAIDMAKMVREINASTVEPEEQLADEVYLIEIA